MKTKDIIYLDYAATTPVDTRVAEVMQHYLTMDGCFANPASNTHLLGLEAKQAVESARAQVANLLNARTKEIVWTSGATEANNLAIIGAARYHLNRGKHIITSKIEHKAVLDTCKYLQGKGFEITYLQPNQYGVIEIEDFKAAIRPDTILASIMHVNNELGSINDIQAIGAICRENKIIFHVDAAQSIGKIPVDMETLPVDLLSLSSHKLYGPKGIGALFIRSKPRVKLEPLIYGGGHEQGLRSGTLAPHQIVALGKACEIAQSEMTAEFERLTQYKNIFWERIKQQPGIVLNGSIKNSVPGIINFSVENVEGTSLLWSIPKIAVSTGSACTSATIEPSYVLRNLGVPDTLAHSALRISFGRFTDEADIAFAAKHIIEGIQYLQAMAPARE